MASGTAVSRPIGLKCTPVRLMATHELYPERSGRHLRQDHRRTARALVVQPDVLFADEPTGSLESLTAEQVIELLVASAREQGVDELPVVSEARRGWT